MKRFFLFAAATVITLIVLGYAGSRIWPDRAAAILIAGNLKFAGLEERQITTDFGTVGYLEGGSGTPVVFLHGIYARKEHWIDMSRSLSGDFRVILPDLPGFGDNVVLGPGEYDYDRQVENLSKLIEALELDRFHIAANSMGAQIAAMLALKHPQMVITIALIGSPVGVASPQPSDMEQAMAKGHMPLVVSTMEEYEARMDWLFPVQPFIPEPLNQLWARAETDRANDNKRIWHEVANSKTPPLLELAPQVEQNTLIVWCRQDRIFHHSGAAVLQRALKQATLVTLEGCGHLPMLDQPSKTGQALLDFLQRQ